MASKKQQPPLLPLPILLGALLVTPMVILLVNIFLPYPRSTFPLSKKSGPPQVSPPPIITKSSDPYKTLMNKLENRQPLSETDEQAKRKILTLLKGKASGTVYASPLTTIDYLKTTDYFQVEILTSNINQAKNEAYSWFITQGMSHQGICDLPVQFYLSAEVKDYLQQPNIEINPLPPGC